MWNFHGSWFLDLVLQTQKFQAFFTKSCYDLPTQKKKKKKKIDISGVDTCLCFIILSSYMPMMMLCITSENNRNIKCKFLDC